MIATLEMKCMFIDSKTYTVKCNKEIKGPLDFLRNGPSIYWFDHATTTYCVMFELKLAAETHLNTSKQFQPNTPFEKCL